VSATRPPEPGRPQDGRAPHPELETARLRLRQLRPDDLAAHHAAVGSDPAVTWDGTAGSLEDSRQALDRHIRHWDRHGFGVWAVVERGGGSLLGHAGLQVLEHSDQVQVSYYLGQAAWGRGIATEAATAALRFGFEHLGLDRIMAVVRPTNTASQHVLTKLGLRHDHDGHFYGLDGIQLWLIDRSTWRPSAAPYRVL
jgi:[ribosomal protein S5]-alanine N-acetyltransferase